MPIKCRQKAKKYRTKKKRLFSTLNYLLLKKIAYIRSFNKPGWSYGFLTDAAYIVDFAHNVEFMISGVIYVNKDGILNDDKYEYDETGYPFFKEVG